MVFNGLHDGDIDAGEQNLEQARANHNMHGHAQQVHHDRYHDKTASNTHDGGKYAHQGSKAQRHEYREPYAGTCKIHLPGQVVQSPLIW